MHSTLFFSVSDGTHGGELWKSDGTEVGTIMIYDLHPGTNPTSGYPNSSSPSVLTLVDGTLFFVADDGSHGWELWALDLGGPPPCVEVSGVTLEQVTADPIYPYTTVELGAAIEPITATAPYTYTIDGGAAMTTTETAIPFTRTFASTGTHTVEIAAWNCAMTVPVTDTFDVQVRARTVYLPIVQER